MTQNEKLAESGDAAFVEAVADELSPIDVREWVIEPDAEELARVSLTDLLIND